MAVGGWRQTRRALMVAVLGTVAAAGAAMANAWPSKPIQLLIPYPPGGSADLLARPLSIRLQERLGQPVLLDYKPGAGGTVASQVLVRAKPDGHTFLLVLAAHAINDGFAQEPQAVKIPHSVCPSHPSFELFDE